ncbi:MAG: polysaccharide deacetylase family protein [Ekhidna sp.]
MIRLVKTPWAIKKWQSSLTWKRNSVNTIYLTFDDGPHPEITPWVMSQLEKVNAKATFFCLGENISRYPEVARDLIKNGHRIGNHTYEHMNGWKTPLELYRQDVSKANELIGDLDSGKTKLFRPPYGRIGREQINALKNDFEIVMWSHLSWDFSLDLNTARMITKLKKCRPGSILLFHDNRKSFKNLKRILPEILAFYVDKGFKFGIL